jgi:hypothetical protein
MSITFLVETLLEKFMKVDMQHFQPLAMYIQFIKGRLKINSGLTDSNNHHIDKNNVVSNVVNNRLNEALGITTKR